MRSIFFASALLLLQSSIVSAECEGQTTEPECQANHMPCESTDDCCTGLGCFGYGFFKKCMDPPLCLAEWYDCSNNMECCDDLICADNGKGGAECQERTVRTVPFNFQGTQPPTASPTLHIDQRTTRIPGEEIVYSVACSVGDPHLYTFDGLNHDCQAEGEFTAVKSRITKRHIQLRSQHFAHEMGWGGNKMMELAITTGVVIQDEGEGTPVIQINRIDMQSSLVSNTLKGVGLQFFVNGVQKDLNDGAGMDDEVLVTVDSNNKIHVYYVKSALKVQVGISTSCGGFLNVCVYLPQNDDVIGLFGSADGDVTNDWMTRENELLEIPPIHERINFYGYEYCTNQWCIENEEESLFVYSETGRDFEDYMHCYLPYGHAVEDQFTHIPQDVKDFCGEDLMCLMDAQIGGLEAAKDAAGDREELKATCNHIGGECNVADCCDGLLCVEGEAGQMMCELEAPTCARELATCSDDLPCCGSGVCTEREDGRKHCVVTRSCQSQWRDCFDPNTPCCGSSECITHIDGRKQCLDLPDCMPEWRECNIGKPCCGDLTCLLDVNRAGRYHCRNLPTCQATEGRPCDGEDNLPPDLGCCEGLTCVAHHEEGGRKMCKILPDVMEEFQSCEYRPCRQDGPHPLECVSVTDAEGRTGQQCRRVE